MLFRAKICDAKNVSHKVCLAPTDLQARNKQTQVWLISIILFEVILKIFGWAAFKVTGSKMRKLLRLSEMIFVDLTVQYL